MSKEKQVTLNSNSSDKDSFSEVVSLPANGSRATGEEKGVPVRLPGSRSSKEGIHRWEQGELAGTEGLRAPGAAYLFVLLHRGGQRKPVRYAGDHRQQHHLPRLWRPGRLSRCLLFSRGGRLHLPLTSPTASRWCLRFPLRWPETAPELSTTGPSN